MPLVQAGRHQWGERHQQHFHDRTHWVRPPIECPSAGTTNFTSVESHWKARKGLVCQTLLLSKQDC
jgi:hypothetical protein